MFEFIKLISTFLPLYIKEVSLKGDVLSISGDGWTFITNSVWRVSRKTELLYTCWDHNAGRFMTELVGYTVVGLSSTSSGRPINPSITFSDGRTLDVYCSLSHEAWALSLPDGCVYTGSIPVERWAVAELS